MTIARLVTAAKLGFIGLFAGALAWTFANHDVEMLVTADTWLAAASVLPLNFLSLLANARRHAILVRRPPVPLRKAFEALILSAGLNIVVPGRVTELVKATYMRRECAVPLAQGVSAVVIERLLDLGAIGMIGLTALIFTELSINSAILAAPALALLALLAAPRLARHVGGRLARGPFRVAGAFIEQALDHVSRLFSWSIALRAAGLTGLVWLLLMLSFVTFLEIQQAHEVSFALAVTVFVAVNLAVAIPGPPAGVGAFQAAVILVLAPAGFAFEEALLLGVVLQAAQIFVATVFMPVLLLRRGTGAVAFLREALSAVRAAASGSPEQPPGTGGTM